MWNVIGWTFCNVSENIQNKLASERKHTLNTQSSNVLLLEFTSKMSLNKSRLSGDGQNHLHANKVENGDKKTKVPYLTSPSIANEDKFESRHIWILGRHVVVPLFHSLVVSILWMRDQGGEGLVG